MTKIGWCGVVLALIYGVCHAVYLRWTSDDAFISFRYAENLMNGLGLVYNAGEWVEGYTNFLWTVLVAFGMSLGCDPITFTNVAGILCYAATLLLLVRTARGQDGSYGFPIAAVGFALHRHAAEFATSGLETALFTFFATAAMVRLITANRLSHYALTGTLIALTCLTRSDGFVIGSVLVAVTAMIAHRQRSWQPLLLVLVPLVCLFLPYYGWRCAYYGYPFPNTYYAKSASSPYFESGLWYVGSYFCYYFVLVPAPFVMLGMIRSRFRQGQPGPLVLAAVTLMFLVYVCWVGGDFMFARFCIPVTPALFLGLQLGLEHCRFYLRCVLMAVVILCTFMSTLCVGWIPILGQTDESDFYRAWRVEAFKKTGLTLHTALAGTDAKVAIGASQAMLGYYARLPVTIELNGLTDEYIAHRQIDVRGRVGHEKGLPLWDDYLNRRGVNFIFGLKVFVEFPDDRIGSLRNIEFLVRDVVIPEDGAFGFMGGRQDLWIKGTMITYEGKLMRQLRSENLRFTPFEQHLDDYIANRLQTRRIEEVREDYAAFKKFYFDRTEDAGRQEVFTRFLEGK
ncbi:MAG: hypothetical protein V3U11_04510 [Planctomycetota bacterium]